MKKRFFAGLMSFVLVVACLGGCRDGATGAEPTASVGHLHIFGDWQEQEAATCSKEGRKARVCEICSAAEEMKIPTTAHDMSEGEVCLRCGHMEPDNGPRVVELGKHWQVYGNPWDFAVRNGMLYVGYGGSTGSFVTTLDLNTKKWTEFSNLGGCYFSEIGGKLVCCTAEGQYFVREDTWQRADIASSYSGCTDVIESGGKIYSVSGSICSVSADSGKTFTHLPCYKNGKELTLQERSKIKYYELWEYKGQVYILGLEEFGLAFYRVEEDKVTFTAYAFEYNDKKRITVRMFNAVIEMGDTCYIVNNNLYATQDFTDAYAGKVIPMPGEESVSDALLKDGILYTLTYKAKADGTYEIAIYKSATGEAGSFTEVVRFDYALPACSMILHGQYFYLGIGNQNIRSDTAGTILRVKNS